MAYTYLTDIDFSAPETEESCGAHIAYTFDFQGGAASGFNTPLMFKSNESEPLSFDKIKALESLGEDVSELRKSYVNQVMSLLQDALDKKFTDGWDWIYVVDADFDNNIVVFCSDYGLFSTNFTLNGLVVDLDDVAVPVMQVTQYQVVDGEMLVSMDFFDSLIDDALSSMVKNAIKQPNVKELLIKAKDGVKDSNSVIAEATPAENPSANTNEMKKGETPLDSINKEEFLKSAEFQDLIKAQIAEAVEKAAEEARVEAQKAADAEIAKARAEAEELRKAEKARIEADYTSVVKSYGYVEEDKVEVLVKYLIDNKEIAETIVSAFQKAQDEVETVKKEFGKEAGVEVENQEPVAKSASDLIRQKAEAIKASTKK